MTQLRGYSDLLAGDEVGGFEGLNIQFPQRIPDNVDESGSTLKYTFGRIETRRQGNLSKLVDEAKGKGVALETTSIADIWPLKKLIQTLVPHLEFQGISFVNEDDIRLSFRVLTTDPQRDVDLDDLSSGEKAILLLFMPLIESEVNRLLEALVANNEMSPSPDRLFLIDEPEQHLHPELQGRVLTYLREEAMRGHFQAILATHSPTLLDLASDTELYVLNRPIKDRNQLSQVASAAERLEALKRSSWVTHTWLRHGRTIVLVEGPPGGGPNTDVRILDRIHPAATKYTFVPLGSRGAVIAAVKGLREQVSESVFGVSILGVVDGDRETPNEEGVIAWPYASIENLLIADSTAISQAIATVAGTSRDPADDRQTPQGCCSPDA